MNGPIQAIIFDLDGVIADSHPIHERAWRELVIEAGQEDALSRLSSLVRSGRTRAEILGAVFPHAAPDELAAWGRRKDDLYRAAANELRPVPGVLAWICQLQRRGVKLALATSASRARALDTLREFGIHQFFAAIVTADDVGLGKPDPALFLRAAEQLGVSPSQALVIEDSEAGLRAAHAAGMLCACYAPEPADAAFASASDFVFRAFTPESLDPLWTRLGMEALPASLEDALHV